MGLFILLLHCRDQQRAERAKEQRAAAIQNAQREWEERHSRAEHADIVSVDGDIDAADEEDDLFTT